MATFTTTSHGVDPDSIRFRVRNFGDFISLDVIYEADGVSSEHNIFVYSNGLPSEVISAKLLENFTKVTYEKPS